MYISCISIHLYRSAWPAASHRAEASSDSAERQLKICVGAFQKGAEISIEISELNTSMISMYSDDMFKTQGKNGVYNRPCRLWRMGIDYTAPWLATSTLSPSFETCGWYRLFQHVEHTAAWATDECTGRVNMRASVEWSRWCLEHHQASLCRIFLPQKWSRWSAVRIGAHSSEGAL